MINRFQSLVLIYVLLLSSGCQSYKEEIECYCPGKITGATSDTIVAQIKVNRGDSAFVRGELSGQVKLPRIKNILDLNAKGGVSGGYIFYNKVDSILRVKNQPLDQKCITKLDKISERCCYQYKIWRNDSLPERIRDAGLEKYLQVEEQYYDRLDACFGDAKTTAPQVPPDVITTKNDLDRDRNSDADLPIPATEENRSNSAALQIQAVDKTTDLPLEGVIVSVPEHQFFAETNRNGVFLIPTEIIDKHKYYETIEITLRADGYNSKTLNLSLAEPQIVKLQRSQ